VQQSLQALPGTLSDARDTLGRLDSSVNNLDGLMRRLGPGAAELQPLAATARPAFADVTAAVPPLLQTVRTLTASAPSLTELLKTGTPFMRNSGGLYSSLTPMLACIRPYAPEAGGAIESAGGWMQTYEIQPANSPQGALLGEPQRFIGPSMGNGLVRTHTARAMPQVSATTLGVYPPGVTTKLFTQLTGQQYAEPRPPGLSVGQPWFIPQCGITPDALNPGKDPEQP
jgi:hypothetical protein